MNNIIKSIKIKVYIDYILINNNMFICTILIKLN